MIFPRNVRHLGLASLPLFFSLAMANSVSALPISQSDVADVLTEHARQNRFPPKLEFQTSAGESETGYVRYTFNQKVHRDMAKVYLQYQPDYACFVALDAQTGAILNLTSFIKADEDWDNLVMRSDYPAASVFKMVTAAAGLDMGKVSQSTVIPFNGKSTTLYKNQVLRHRDSKWTRTPTLKESFAKSINPVFGQIGVFHLGAANLTEYASKFGFGRDLQTDFNLPQSEIRLDFDSKFEIAEAASGYTRDITLSPIHAAQMAAIIANDGKMVTPYMVNSIVDKAGKLLYKTQATNEAEQVISSDSAEALRELMRETTRIGSARGSFRGLSQYKVYKGMEIGGKTGSLTGFSPRGRHDWFVGYAEKDGRTIAYASLIINKEKWYVRSAYVARQFIYHYFTQQDSANEMVAN
ncbi:MAG: peptidoglycan glycosyltransferase [Cryomorphaceae bacterium]|jgi:peptidoglycan glycosyltransferase